MYIHLGQETVIPSEDIVGIFDLDSSTVSKHTRKFLAVSEKQGRVVNVSYELPKSFAVCCDKNKKTSVYISQISTATLLKRKDFLSSINKKEE